MGDDLVVITWNVLHLRDGFPGLGPTPASTWRRRAVRGPTHVHLNRAYPEEVAAVIRRLRPTVAALQEVPAGAVAHLARRTGMNALWHRTGLPLGPAGVRWALGRRNPDLWRTRQGNANALLVDRRWRIEAGSARAWRLNPLTMVARIAHRPGLDPGEVVNWVIEPRGVVGAVLRGPGGRGVAVAAVHAHNARTPAQALAELARLGDLLDGWAGTRSPLLLAGDLNARLSHPAVESLQARLGLGAAGPAARPDPGLGIDLILHRGLEVRAAPRPLPASVRELVARSADGDLRVMLSDHDVVRGAYRLTGSAPRAAPPGSG